MALGLKFHPPALDDALEELYTAISICSAQAARDSKPAIQRRLSAVVEILRDAARRLESVSDAANGRTPPPTRGGREKGESGDG